MKTFNRILSMLLVVAMVMSIAVMGVVAEEDPATKVVTTADDLAQYLADATVTTVILGSDIDFSAYTGTYPISVTAGTTLEGNGNTLKNVALTGNKGLFDLQACKDESTKAIFNNFNIGTEDVPATFEAASGNSSALIEVSDQKTIYSTWTDVDVVAVATIKANNLNVAVFFGRVSGIQRFTDCDVTFSQEYINGASYANGLGCFIGRCYDTVYFTNCTTSGSVVGGNNTAGFVGKQNTGRNATFTNCINYADIMGVSSNTGNAVGGFVGDSDDATAEANRIPRFTNCKNFGVVTSKGAYTGHYTGNVSATDLATGQVFVPSNVETQVVDGVEYQTIHNLTDLTTELQTTGKYILAQNIDMSGLTASISVAKEGIELEGNGMSLLKVTLTANAGIFNSANTNETGKTAIYRNFTVGTRETPAVGKSTIMASGSGNSVWENVTVYATLEPDTHAGVFGHGNAFVGNWTFTNVHVFVDVKNVSGNAIGGFFGRFAGNATFTDCSVNNLTEKGLLQNNSQNIGGYIGKAQTKGNTINFTRCVNNANINSNGSSHGTAAFVGANNQGNGDHADIKFYDCVNTGKITDTGKSSVAVAVGAVSGTEQIITMINLGELSGNTLVEEREQMLYNGELYTIDPQTKTVSINDEIHTVIAAAKDFEKLANAGNFILFSNIRMGAVAAPYAVADGVVFDGCGNSLLDVTLVDTASLFVFTAGSAATFKNFTVGSADAPVETSVGVFAAAEWATNEPASNMISYGAFNTTWENVNIHASLRQSSVNQGGFFGGNLEGEHTFNNCHATIVQTQQNSQIGAFVGRQASGSVTFTGCTANGTIAATTNGGGFIAKTNGAVQFEDCVNNAAISNSNAAGGFIGLVDAGANISFKNSTNKGIISAAKHGAGFVAETGTSRATIAVAFDTCVNEGTVNDASVTAGFFAYSAPNVTIDTLIVNSRNEAAITGGQTGGLFGVLNTANINIWSCVNAGTITSSNQGAGILAGNNASTVVIRDSVNLGSVTSTGWAAGFVRREKQVTIENCVNKGEIVGGASYSAQFVATQPGGSTADSIVIKNSYALGTVNGGAVDAPWTIADILSTLENNSTVADDRYNNRFNEDGTLHVIKGAQETEPIDKGYATTVYDVRLLAGLDTYEYDNVQIVVNITMGSYKNTLAFDVKKVFEKVTAADGENAGKVQEVAASEFGANYFAAVVITDVPTGVADVVFEVTTYVTENGVTYQLGRTATVTYDTTGTWVNPNAN